MPQHRRQEFLSSLKRIDQQTPSELDLHLIVDNYAAHKHPDVERWFRNLTHRCLRRGSFHYVKELTEGLPYLHPRP